MAKGDDMPRRWADSKRVHEWYAKYGIPAKHQSGDLLKMIIDLIRAVRKELDSSRDDHTAT